MLKISLKFGAALLFSGILSACSSLGHLNYKQAHMLKKEGFVLTQEGWSLGLPERLLFNFNDYSIAEKQKGDLIRLSDQLHQYKLNKLKIVGHTDNVGDKAYNQQLSFKRASSVAEVFFSTWF